MSGCTADLFGQVVNLGLDENFIIHPMGGVGLRSIGMMKNDGGLVQCEHTTRSKVVGENGWVFNQLNIGFLVPLADN